jgi:hypothetical protein
MDVLAWMGDAGIFLLRVVLVVAPLLVWRWTIALTSPYRAGTRSVGPTLAASVMGGLGALAATLPHSIFTWDAIVSRGGFWDLKLPEFLAVAAGVVWRAIPTLLEVLQSAGAQSNLVGWIAAIIVIWSTRLAIGLHALPLRNARLRFLAAELACFLAGMFATIYLGTLLPWLANRLNFWLFLVLILLIQDYRYGHPPLLWRLTGWLTMTPRGQVCAPHDPP